MYLKANLNIYSNVVQNTLNDDLKGLLGVSLNSFTAVHCNLRKTLNFTISTLQCFKLASSLLADLHHYMLV